MHTALGNDRRYAAASLLTATILVGGIFQPLPAFASSLLSTPVLQAAPSRGIDQPAPKEKLVQQALEAPAKTIPMPDPLINDKANQGSGSGSPAADSKSIEVIYDINKAPEPVRKLREMIVEAAASGDLERLRPLMNVGGGLNQTQITADDPGEDPIKSLHDLSGDADGIEVLSILLDIMSTGFAHVGAGTADDMYVWPYFAEKDIKTLTAPEKVDLMRIVTAGDYSDMLEFGGYNFYRVGITPDGKWKFFSAGE
jgi:hypothetical protein